MMIRRQRWISYSLFISCVQIVEAIVRDCLFFVKIEKTIDENSLMEFQEISQDKNYRQDLIEIVLFALTEQITASIISWCTSPASLMTPKDTKCFNPPYQHIWVDWIVNWSFRALLNVYHWNLNKTKRAKKMSVHCVTPSTFSGRMDPHSLHIADVVLFCNTPFSVTNWCSWFMMSEPCTVSMVILNPIH